MSKHVFFSKELLGKSQSRHSLRSETSCQCHLTSAFPWFCPHWPWVACPATARAGGSKRTCFPCRCLCTYKQHNYFCLVFSKKFNILSALSVHQSPTLPQKIDSREGLFWCKKGLACACSKMNLYLKRQPSAPVIGLFAAKCTAFWCKTQAILVQNARCFGAKCKPFWR